MLVFCASRSIVIGVRVGLGVPMAFRVGDSFTNLDEDLGGHHLLYLESLMFGDGDIFLTWHIDHDGVSLDLGDHDVSIIFHGLWHLDSLLFGVALGHHDVKGDILGYSDLAGDRLIVLLVDGDLDGNLDVRVLGGGSGRASTLGIAAAAVPLALAATLLLEARALLL